jgi:hypothetical protein
LNLVIEMRAGGATGIGRLCGIQFLQRPFDCDLELAIIDSTGAHAVSFPCRRELAGWIKAETNRPIDLRPTHWREWATDGRSFGDAANDTRQH